MVLLLEANVLGMSNALLVQKHWYFWQSNMYNSEVFLLEPEQCLIEKETNMQHSIGKSIALLEKRISFNITVYGHSSADFDSGTQTQCHKVIRYCLENARSSNKQKRQVFG